METPNKTNPAVSDVLHSQGHSQLSAEEIAKAVARHKREHPDGSGKNAKKGGKKAR